MPLLGLLLGAVLPQVAATAREALIVSVPVLVFAGVAAIEPTPPTRHDMRTSLLMLIATAFVCPLTVAALAALMELPGDLPCAAVLAAAAPAAMGTGVLSQRFGLPARHAVWAALLGLTTAPLLLPMIAALGGIPHLSTWPLAARAALFGAAPACAALGVKQFVSAKTIAALVPDLKGVVVLALGAIALASGGRLGGAIGPIAHGDPGAVIALLVAVGSVVTSASAAWVFGWICGGSVLARALLVTGAARNASFAWAAMSSLSPNGDLVMAVSVAGAFLLPPIMLRSKVNKQSRHFIFPGPASNTGKPDVLSD